MAPVSGQRVQEGVAGRVVGLARGAQHTGHGGEQDEGVQVEMAGQVVQVPGGVHLGPHHLLDTLRGERGEHAVVQYARGVHHPGQRRRGRHPGHHVGELPAVRDVAGQDLHRVPGGGQFGGQARHAGGARAPPRGQQQPLGPAATGQVPCRQAAERPRGAGHQHRAGPAGRGGRQRQHRLGHRGRLPDRRPEDLRGLPYVPAGHRQGLQRPLLEQSGQLRQVGFELFGAPAVRLGAGCGQRSAAGVEQA